MRGRGRTRSLARLTVALGGALIVTLAACADLPEGVDGDLTGGWDELPDPSTFRPAAQVCHEEAYSPVASVEHYRPVDCDRPHLVETVHVAAFTGEAGDREAPPAPDDWEWRAAFAQCEEQAAEFLGAEHRYGRIWLGVGVPSQEAWDSGARWFRCDLSELEAVSGEPVMREGSLAGALADRDAALRLGCFQVNVEDGLVAEKIPVACDEPHQAEFVGTWRAPDGSYPDAEDSDAVDRVYTGCRSRIAAYTDVPDDGDVRFRVGTIVDWMSSQDWEAGDRAFRCYLWVSDGELTTSLRGAGTDELPVRTG
jgi:hypothetical protein